MKTAISFDDVLLVPKHSTIASRKEVDIGCSSSFGHLELPIVSSPMDTVTESRMAITMSRHGGLGVVHRYNSIADQVDIVAKVSEETGNAAAAIGISGDFLERAQALFDAGAKILCVDVAHGHHELTKSALRALRRNLGGHFHLMAGNVATLEGFNDLSDWGADSIRVGIGGGSICSTRIQTGHGVPTLQSVLDCSRSDRDSLLIADGGIRTAGDVVKCIAAGADAVMLGSVLAGTDETPGAVFVDNSSNKYKVYRGMASREAQTAWRGKAASLEGVSTTIPYKGRVSDILLDLAQNIRSGFSYSGARNQKELRSMCQFVKQTSSGIIESSTHILRGRS